MENDLRYEIKYVLPLVDRYMIDQMVFNHPASFSTAFPDRLINNLYFDTQDLQYFYQNINGDPNRSKYRYRWYGLESEWASGQLEKKNKSNMLGWKDYFKLCYNPFERNELKSLAPELISVPNGLFPSLYNQYKRSYFLSQDKKFRLTIDQFIKYKLDLNSPVHIKEERIVIELKFDKKDETEFEFIKNHIPFRQDKYSKYANGLIGLNN